MKKSLVVLVISMLLMQSSMYANQISKSDSNFLFQNSVASNSVSFLNKDEMKNTEGKWFSFVVRFVAVVLGRQSIKGSEGKNNNNSSGNSNKNTFIEPPTTDLAYHNNIDFLAGM